ncbi:conserved hypothetical protein [Desulforamulus reducens MI-1]|uniref:Uncharacterized protein n=1 Tax=Desulforamulus reducens (strain ATCC BAA-1160 / DSM 100696 / MI-1) TaxID=349161 RepID=A4J9K7_DESRM|nr:conserved hypothetical protein [Desulforamulus reducens MI-1]
MAYDTIDKIDRNLFERNCDAQAWASFDKVKSCFYSTESDRITAANELLKKLIDIYDIIDSARIGQNGDIFIINKHGYIIACRKSQGYSKR